LSLQTKGVILAIISAICYGMNPLGALFLYEEGLNVNSVIFYRFIFASILLAIFMIIKKDSFYLKFKEIILLALLGLLFGISAISLFNSFLYMDAGLASTVLFIYPIFVAIIMALFFKEKNSIITILSIIFAFLGVVLLYESDGANDVREGVAIMWLEDVDVSITGNSTNPTRFQHPVAGTYKKERLEAGKKYFSVASGGGTGRTLHPDNMAAGPASYGMTDTMGRMHSDAQFAGSSSVPAHVDMMGLIGMGNNPMVGATVAVAVAISNAG
jgi:uncharacterized membrane protein